MARPKAPLLSRERVVNVALAIIDERGVEALSVPTLAEELGVRAPSLYHHFRDKAEILSEVARSIMLNSPVPKIGDPSEWMDWMIELYAGFRKAVLRHRNAALLFVQFLPRDLLVGAYERSARVMEQAGVPVGNHVLILDGLDKLMIGTIVFESRQDLPNRAHTYSGFDPETHARLAHAVEVYSATSDELFRQSARAYIQGCLDLAAAQEAKATARRKTAAPSTRSAIA